MIDHRSAHTPPTIPSSAARSRRQQQLRSRYGAWAIVTGASSGIGRELALRLAEAGLHLVLVARSQNILEQLATDLGARYGVEARVIAADLGQETGVATVEAGTRDLDIGLLVAAAGFGTAGPFLDSAFEQELDMLAVNCRALLALSHAFGRRFAARGRGGIILISSILAFQGTPYAAHYAATKAYVQTLAEGLQAELAPLGVDVLASAPGPTHSGFAARAEMRMGLALKPGDVAQATLDALGRRSTVLPGWLSKLLRVSLAPLPRRMRTQIMGQVMRGMSMTQRSAQPETGGS